MVGNQRQGSNGRRNPSRGRGWGLLSVPVALAAAVCAGCSPFQAHRERLQMLHAQGRFDVAAQVMDRPEMEDLYGQKNRLLYWLDRGAVALALHDDDTTIGLLNRAENYMEVYRQPSAEQEAARWLINDTAAPYFGEPYEDMYVNVLKLIAQLEKGRIQGGATVEAKRMASKADVLHDRYLKYTAALERRAGPGFDDVVRQGNLVPTNNGGRFIESPLGTYLTAVTYMEVGDRANQSVAGRRLLSSIRLQGALVGPVDPSPFANLGERRADSANVLVVALSGRTPRMVAERVGPVPIFDWPVYFELPVMTGGSEMAAAVRVVVGPAAPAEQAEAGPNPEGEDEEPSGPAASGWDAHPLHFIEDMRSVAAANHRRELPFIYARTLLRASLKAGASFAVTQAVRHNAKDDAAAFATVLGGLALLALTERADLRSWIFLPGRADVGLMDLPPGRRRMRVEYLSAGGGVLYAGPWRTVDVPASGLVTVVEHYWQ